MTTTEPIIFTSEERGLCKLAERMIDRVLREGRATHQPNDWIDLVERHIPCAIGHLNNADRMRRGQKPEDHEGIEGHLERAATRALMALYCARMKRRESTEQCADPTGFPV